MTRQTSKIISLAALAGLVVGLIGCASVRATDTQTPTQPVPAPYTSGQLNQCSRSDPFWSWYSRVRIPAYGQPGVPVFGGMNYVAVILTNKLTAAELAPEIKNRVSHRGIAMQALAKKLRAHG